MRNACGELLTSHAISYHAPELATLSQINLSPFIVSYSMGLSLVNGLSFPIVTLNTMLLVKLFGLKCYVSRA